MNKGLETLNLLKDFVLENNKNGLDRRFIIGSCDILEQELKDYEVLKKDFESMREFKYKQLDALEIIKKKKVNTAFLFEMWEDEEQEEEFILENYNFNYEPSLTQKEYDLLKEVL